MLWESMQDESWEMQELQRALCESLLLKSFLKDQIASKLIYQSNLHSSSLTCLDARKIFYFESKDKSEIV